MKNLILALAMILAISVVSGLQCYAQDVIWGCYQKDNGQLRIVSGSSDCRPDELPISWYGIGPGGPFFKGADKAATGETSPLPGRSFMDPVTGMQFVFVKGGCFPMGDSLGDGYADEKPAHEVCLDDFYLGGYEVRVGDFRKFVNETGYRTEAESGDGCYTYRGDKWEKDRNANWRNPGFAIDDRHPVVCVSWNDSMAFTDWLKKKTGKQYRLPREAEWEYAARDGGKNVKYSWGNGEPSGNIADESAKRQFPKQNIWSGYDDGYVFTAPVGSFRPNELGLYDMTGNVWEWCSDWYGQNYYQGSPKNNPEGPSKGSNKVLRGGSWSNDSRNLRAVYRGGNDPANRSYFTGFRLGLSAQAAQASDTGK